MLTSSVIHSDVATQSPACLIEREAEVLTTKPASLNQAALTSSNDKKGMVAAILLEKYSGFGRSYTVTAVLVHIDRAWHCRSCRRPTIDTYQNQCRHVAANKKRYTASNHGFINFLSVIPLNHGNWRFQTLIPRKKPFILIHSDIMAYPIITTCAQVDIVQALSSRVNHTEKRLVVVGYAKVSFYSKSQSLHSACKK